MRARRNGLQTTGKGRILWDAALISAALAALLVLPYVGYTYNEVIYTLTAKRQMPTIMPVTMPMTMKARLYSRVFRVMIQAVRELNR